MEIRLNWLYKLNSGRRRTALCSAVALIFEPHFKTVLRGLTTYMNFYFESLSTYIKILSPQDLLGRSLAITPCYQRPNCGIVVCLEFNINYLQLHSDQAR